MQDRLLIFEPSNLKKTEKEFASQVAENIFYGEKKEESRLYFLAKQSVNRILKNQSPHGFIWSPGVVPLNTLKDSFSGEPREKLSDIEIETMSALALLIFIHDEQ